MPSPTVDIIVPVWNKPFETRACLAAILAHSPEARLIIIANGSNRETELMLEEFSEPLGERGLFISSDRNLGLIKAINMGLSRSDSDYAVIVRPHVEVTTGWLERLLEAAQGGLATPLFSGGTMQFPKIASSCSMMETFNLTFSALAIKGELHMLIGGFNEEMDGAEWCLRDYMRRAWNRGYRTSVSYGAMLRCHPEVVFGSPERRRENELSSSAYYKANWGISRHFCIYFGKQAEAGSLAVSIDTILEGARQGHTFTLLLHRRQAADFHRIGWDCLHTGITLQKLSMLAPRRDLLKRLAVIKAAAPETIIVQESAETLLSDSVTPIPLAELSSLWEHTTQL